MKGYKGFNPGLVCEGEGWYGKYRKQYEENTVYEEDQAVICKKGMHFCVNPFDVLDHYPLINSNGEFSDFAEVEALADVKTDDNKKYCTTKMKIGAKLSFAGFVKACVDFVIEKTTISNEEVDKMASDGNYAQIGSSGDSAQIGSSGNYAKIGSSGDSAQIGSSGNYAKIGSSGNYAQIDCSGDDSVICCAGNNSIVKAKKGCWITLAEWKWSEEKERTVPVCVKTEFVDGDRIKENVFYKLENGEFVEAY